MAAQRADGVGESYFTINSNCVIKDSMYDDLPCNNNLRKLASKLRKAGNLSEVLLWLEVKNKKFHGLDFFRQKIIGNYIVDFFCAAKRAVIEIDGESHNEKLDYDKERDEFMEQLGLKVIRIYDIEVKKNLGGVLRHLERELGLI